MNGWGVLVAFALAGAAGFGGFILGRDAARQEEIQSKRDENARLRVDVDLLQTQVVPLDRRAHALQTWYESRDDELRLTSRRP